MLIELPMHRPRPVARPSSIRRWQNFSDWLQKVPSVNYGMYTYEGDAAISAQLPALIQGTPVDKLLDAIAQQLSAQIK